MQEIEQETAKISSSSFFDTVWANKAYLMLKRNVLPENEERFKALVLLLNGRIKQTLRLNLDDNTLNPIRIFNHILELDATISTGMSLPSTPLLNYFQTYAKGILFRSMGDTFLLLNNEEHGNRRYEELAYACYSLAFDIFYKTSPKPSLLAAIFELEILTLHTLLQHFSIGELLYSSCRGPSNSRFKSFMISIKSVPSSHKMYVIGHKQLCKLNILINEHDFLINLLWLIAYNEDIRGSALFFNELFNNISIGEFEDDLQSFTASSFSRIDAQILLISAAKWSKLNLFSRRNLATPKLKILPPALFPEPSYMFINFWNSLVSLIRSKTCSPKQCSENGLILSALEASRLRGDIPDLRILNFTRKWLIMNGNALGDVKGSWAKLYSQVFMDLVNGAHYANQSIPAESFFPPLNDFDYDMLDDTKTWLAPEDSCNQLETNLVNHVPSNIEKESSSDALCNRKTFLQRISISSRLVCRDCRHSVISSRASRSKNIKALKMLNENHSIRCKNDNKIEVGTISLLTAVENSGTNINSCSAIIQLQEKHAKDVSRLVQTMNSLQEKLIHHTEELSVYTSEAYKKGYADGYYSALSMRGIFGNPLKCSDQHGVHPFKYAATFETDIGDQIKDLSPGRNPHNAKECIGCASEEGLNHFHLESFI
ncbi:unnamed protein product [Thelazia callipaeda]|uniref:EST1_DNA_bind domain-containing protein n=1 Tax=Thelazia callipaeda TaxID=103827 RepID=A0A0N5D623_THECL|nr:unnamed protein product [Thelazia callipaeda]